MPKALVPGLHYVSVLVEHGLAEVYTLKANGLGVSYIPKLDATKHPELLTAEDHYFSVPTSNKDS